MRFCTLRLLPLLMLFAPSIAAAQLPIPVAVEGRLGWALPQGDFEEADSGFSAGAGPSVALGARVDLIPMLGIFGGYQQTWFECASCSAVALDDAAVLKGYELGARIAIPVAASGVSPWLRAAVTQQTLGFSGSGETFTSEASIGFSGSAGITVPLASRLEISPGLRYQSAPAEFDFDALPDRSVDVSALALDISLAFRL